MKTIKIFSATVPLWLLLTVSLATALLISGIVYATLDILQSYDFGYTKIGETRSIVILRATNGTIIKNSLNISTTCNGTQSINAVLLYKDPSGVSRTQNLNLEGDTVFAYDFIDIVNLTVSSVQAGQYRCQLEFLNDSTTFTNFVSVLP